MTQEEKDLVLKDLSARWTYGVCVHIRYKEGEPCYGKLTPKDIQWFIDSKIEVIKPYLRPMSSMTEEEAKEIAILHDIKNILSIKITGEYIDVVVDDGFCSTEIRTIWYDEIISSIEIFDWLNKHHFDYRGLIEKGLAIKAPEGMYTNK